MYAQEIAQRWNIKDSGVQVRVGNEAFGTLNLYESGLIDIAGVDYLNLERIVDPAGPWAADLRISPLFSVEYIAFRSDVEPLSDRAIRQALIAAFPRERLAEVTFTPNWKLRPCLPNNLSAV